MAVDYPDRVDYDDYTYGTYQIVWGLVFSLVNLRLGGFDIMPDVIGYFLVVLGLKKLMALNEHFNRARTFALLLILFAVPNLFEPPNLFSNGLTPLSIILTVLSIVPRIINLFLIYHVFKGITEVASGRTGSAPLASTAQNRWRVYLYVQCAYLAFEPFVLNLAALPALFMMFLLFVLLIIMEIIIIRLIYRFGKEVIPLMGAET